MAKDRKTEVAAMMRRKTGVTTAQIQEKTGMQEHSARALISGIAKTIVKPEVLVKTKNGDKATVYAIVTESKAAA